MLYKIQKETIVASPDSLLMLLHSWQVRHAHHVHLRRFGRLLCYIEHSMVYIEDSMVGELLRSLADNPDIAHALVVTWSVRLNCLWI